MEQLATGVQVTLVVLIELIEQMDVRDGHGLVLQFECHRQFQRHVTIRVIVGRFSSGSKYDVVSIVQTILPLKIRVVQHQIVDRNVRHVQCGIRAYDWFFELTHLFRVIR